jgi:hypothetical protein
MSICSHCDGQCGSAATYAGQACLPLNGRVRSIDWCIHHIVAALNAAGIETVASCCGHMKTDGRIDLADGRTLVIKSAIRTAKGGLS